MEFEETMSRYFSHKNLSICLLALSLSVFAVGCKKKTPAASNTNTTNPTPAAPPAAIPAPTVRSFSVEPTSITAGQSATLRWAVEGADTVSLSAGIGSVQASGSRSVSPGSTITYRLTAVNRGGTTERSVTLNVAAAPPPDRPAPTVSSTKSFSESVNQMLKTVYFDYDKSDIRDDSRGTLNSNAEAIKQLFSTFPNSILTVEGHCDERGTAEYNLGLGDRRSSSVKEYLVNLGVPGDRLKVISYGNERKACLDDNDPCHAKNRRAQFSAN
jgi:peptidoglycan-associated lipoprotein